MIIKDINKLKEFKYCKELGEILNSKIKDENYILTKINDVVILMDDELTRDDIVGLDNIIYTLVEEIYSAMYMENDGYWFEEEEILAKCFPSKFVTYRLEVKKIKHKNYIYENVERGDIIIIGGDIKEDVEWAENNSLGLSTGFIVVSKNEDTITVKGDKEEREISYKSVWGIYKNVSDYVFWLDSEK